MLRGDDGNASRNLQTGVALSAGRRSRAEARPPTIADVARAAGVGVGTVSRVLNGGKLVSGPTQLRVLGVIEELGYQPTAAAQSLRRGRTNTIAVIAPFFTTASVVERLRGVVSVLRESEYELVLHDVETPEQRRHQVVDLAGRTRTDGAIIVSFPLEAGEADLLARAGVPAVLLDSEHPALPSVTVDNTAGGYLATHHLLQLGHRQIAFVGDLERNPFGFTSSARRLEGYRLALAEAGVEPSPEQIKEGPHGRHVAHRLLDELLAAKVRPTAVFAASDTQALGVIEGATAAGVSVPGELSVVGFDDVEIAAYVGLTTVRQPLYESGRRAADLLLGLLEEPRRDLPGERLPLELVARRTSGAAAATE
jgi:LacI family transcriptional regulator